MSSINKFSFIRWILGMALVATSGIALAGDVPATFATDQVLTAAKMNEIATAINDNDTRVDGMQTGVPVCVTGSSMTRVGTICVDNARSGPSVAWNDAINVCRAAGKRLLTPAEYIAAFNQGVITANDVDEFEFVDSVSNDASSDGDITGGISGNLTVGFIGPISGVIFFSTQQPYTTASSIIFYRCAR
jgi:hypothetical protein